MLHCSVHHRVHNPGRLDLLRLGELDLPGGSLLLIHYSHHHRSVLPWVLILDGISEPWEENRAFKRKYFKIALM